jgi:3-dehydrotetronate 4-kinase
VTAPWLGIVADDTTGACDVAGGLTQLGVTTTLVLGVPNGDLDEPADCVVVGLQTRTAPADRAVADSVASAQWLLSLGVTRLYQKYCSTFDSTDRGNIGPIAEALADVAGSGVSVGTPATPEAGRTQYGGQLFIDGVPLAESPMRDHPLTPMTDSDLVRVLERQSTRPVDLLAPGERFVAPNSPRHILADAAKDADLDSLADDIALAGSSILAGGGAGLALALARGRGRRTAPVPRGTVEDGGALILCGSGSVRTREQIANFTGPVISFDPVDFMDDEDARVARLMRELAARRDSDLRRPLLVTSTNQPDQVRAAQSSIGVGAAAAVVERVLGEVAVRAVESQGIRRIIVAGGETSGAITSALGITRLAIHALAASGVPWTVGTRPDGTAIALLLKSGNFGEPHLFATAWEASP